MENTSNTPKKLFIASGILFLLVIVVMVVISIINGVNQASFNIATVSAVRSDAPYLKVCFNKPITLDASRLEGQGLIAKPQRAPEDSCTIFNLAKDDNTPFALGQYTAHISTESESGKKMENQELVFTVVESTDKDALSDDELGNIIDANNDAAIEGWMAYWEKQPIYKHVDPTSFAYQPYENAGWSLALREDDKGNPTVMIFLAMPEPPKDDVRLNYFAGQLKKDALDTLNGWDVSDKDYPVRVEYTSSL